MDDVGPPFFGSETARLAVVGISLRFLLKGQFEACAYVLRVANANPVMGGGSRVGNGNGDAGGEEGSKGIEAEEEVSSIWWHFL